MYESHCRQDGSSLSIMKNPLNKNIGIADAGIRNVPSCKEKEIIIKYEYNQNFEYTAKNE